MSSKKDNSTTGREDTIARLEAALEAEKAQSLALGDQLEKLEKKLAEVEARLDGRLEEALARAEKAESRLQDQSARLEVLGTGREESMLALSQVRSELALITSERDKLRRQLTDVEDMQTETATFSDEDSDDDEADATNGSKEQLPSIEELMANINAKNDGDGANGFSDAKAEDVEPPEAEWKEMIAPEAIVADAEGAGGVKNAIGAPTQLLVNLDEDNEDEHPLTEPLTTIGRSASADIAITGNFISRIHARILVIGAETVIEDAGSKNGIRVNSERVERHVLRDGDLIRIGTVRFRFVDRSDAA